MKTHDSGICDHIRLLHDDDGQGEGASPTNVSSTPPSSSSTKKTENRRVDASPRVADPVIVADQLKEVKTVLDALQDEFAAMSFEHHELTNRLKALGGDHLAADIRSASQDAEISSLETQLGDLVAKMNVKGSFFAIL